MSHLSPLYCEHLKQTVNSVEGLTKVLLPTEKVQLWLRHLETVASNRTHGAEKELKPIVKRLPRVHVLVDSLESAVVERAVAYTKNKQKRWKSG